MKDFFYLQRNDRRALLGVLAVIAAAIGVIHYAGRACDEAEPAAADSTAHKAEYAERKEGTANNATYHYAEERKTELFTFDPNTADSTQLLRLGLAPWQVRNIYLYRAKGGVYRKKTDFARLYGLTVGQYKRLEPYISISGDYRPAAEVYAQPEPDTYKRDTTRYPLKLTPGQTVSLNTADTALLKRVPGIGGGFAGAIVRYRERLGGYYSTRQLLEIDNFPKSALPYFTADASACKKLNVNKMTLSQLRRHPYIGFYRAKTITDHRRLHGPIHGLDELSLYRDFPREAIERLKAYVEF